SVAFEGGCTGHYIVTVPDQVAPAGGEWAAVVRLQRSEIAIVALPVRGALMRLQIEDGLERGAYTDSIGYAGTPLPAPNTPGRYTLHVAHMDPEGDEVFKEVPAYVWDPTRPVIAVDMDSLPPLWQGKATVAARKALWRLADGAGICYLTRQSVRHHPAVHRDLDRGGYPDGPVLMWQRKRWHIVRESRWRVRIVVESRLVSQLPGLRRMFPRLDAGITGSSLSAKAFSGAGMRVVVVGSAQATGPNVVRRSDWEDLAQRGISPEGAAADAPAAIEQ
ncbi:MAG TPA: hypothetical protein VNA25_18075, partial [Phycisphaerae bacterium]|nr:hypothetical protein [Phycisphaerae bacterium]